MILQLNPPIPFCVPEKGDGLAVLVIDYGPDYDLIWVVILDSGEVWSARNQQIRGVKNWTMGRTCDAFDR